MASYLFVTRGMDITRKSVTGPGCTLSRPHERIALDLPDDVSDETKIELLAQFCFDADLPVGKAPGFAIDDMGRCVVYFRGMAVAALVPEKIWAGFLFCKKLSA